MMERYNLRSTRGQEICTSAVADGRREGTVTSYWVFGCPLLLYNRHMTLNCLFDLTRVMRKFVQLYLFHTLTFADDGGPACLMCCF